MRVAVLGFGRSGRAAFELLREKDHEVYVFDDVELKVHDGNFFCGRDADRFYDFDFDEIILSPGIKPAHRFVEYAIDRGISVVSELELASRYIIGGKVIAVTGTNGKTTTVRLLNEMLRKAGKRSIACGNYGLPLSEAANKNVDYYVVEASSFQLEFIDKFRPHVAGIVNIAFDHVKWHGSEENYRRAKLKIFKNQKEGDFFIRNDRDDYRFDGKAKLLRVSEKDIYADCFVGRDEVVVNNPAKFIIKKTGLFGRGSLENIAFAALMASLVGVSKQTIKEVVANMSNLEHRMEYVEEIDGIKFYNDSKATNLDAVRNAIESFGLGDRKRLILILGGRHKGEPYSKLLPLLEKRVKALVVYGEDRKTILQELHDFIPVPLPAVNIWGAIRAAFEVATKGDIVLFSPGGSSCEPYKDYAERGNAFKKEIKIFKEEYEKAPSV